MPKEARDLVVMGCIFTLAGGTTLGAFVCRGESVFPPGVGAMAALAGLMWLATGISMARKARRDYVRRP